MTSARNSRVSFVRNVGIIGHSTHAPKTVKYFVYVNIFAKYNQYFLLFILKLKPFIRTINVSQLTQWLLFTDNWFFMDSLCPTKWFAQSRTTPLWISSNLTPKTKKDFILRHIATTQWCGKARPGDEYAGDTVFWIDKLPQGPQFQMTFCKKCGNYKDHMTSTYKTACWC